MVKSGADRAAKYKAKFDAEVVRSRYAATADLAKEAQATLQEQLATKTAQVRQILNDNGIMPILTAPYLSFSHKLFGIVRKFSGQTAVNTAQLEYDKWKAMGLNTTVLQAIWALYSDVLGAEPPTP
jgi:hypothetical protein